MNQLFPAHSIARRFQLGVGIAAGFVLGLTVWFNYRVSRDELERQTNAKAVTEIRAAARRLDDFITRLGMLTRAIAVRQQASGRSADSGPSLSGLGGGGMSGLGGLDLPGMMP